MYSYCYNLVNFISHCHADAVYLITIRSCSAEATRIHNIGLASSCRLDEWEYDRAAGTLLVTLAHSSLTPISPPVRPFHPNISGIPEKISELFLEYQRCENIGKTTGLGLSNPVIFLRFWNRDSVLFFWDSVQITVLIWIEIRWTGVAPEFWFG